MLKRKEFILGAAAGLEGAAGASRWAVRTAVTEVIPGIACTAFSAAWRSGSSCGPRFGSTSIEKPMLESLTTSPEIMFRLTMSACLSGSITVRSASSTCVSVTCAMVENSDLFPILADNCQPGRRRAYRPL